MHIYGPAHLHGAHPVNSPHSSRAAKPAAPDPSAPIQDELELSDAARVVEKVRDVPDIRHDRVEEIRAQIEAGTYETDEKLEIAVGRLLDEIG
jgi:negative regulator of flagellin synthesis FlgM